MKNKLLLDWRKSRIGETCATPSYLKTRSCLYKSIAASERGKKEKLRRKQKQIHDLTNIYSYYVLVDRRHVHNPYITKSTQYIEITNIDLFAIILVFILQIMKKMRIIVNRGTFSTKKFAKLRKVNISKKSRSSRAEHSTSTGDSSRETRPEVPGSNLSKSKNYNVYQIRDIVKQAEYK